MQDIVNIQKIEWIKGNVIKEIHAYEDIKQNNLEKFKNHVCKFILRTNDDNILHYNILHYISSDVDIIKGMVVCSVCFEDINEPYCHYIRYHDIYDPIDEYAIDKALVQKILITDVIYNHDTEDFTQITNSQEEKENG